jgi:hypothetical protein
VCGSSQKASVSSVESDRLQNENILLKSQLQQERAKLSSLSQLLLGTTQPPDSAGMGKKSQSCETEHPQINLSSPSVPKSSHSSTHTHVSPFDKVTDSTDAIAFTKGDAPKLPNSDRSVLKKSGSAIARAERIFEAIQQWNQSHPDDLFAVNRGLLETAFGINRKAVGIFTDTHKDILEQYHQYLGISPFSHNRGKDTRQLKAFVTQRLEQS